MLRYFVLIKALIFFLFIGLAILSDGNREKNNKQSSIEVSADSKEKKIIKWVDFTVSYEALNLAYEWDIGTYGEEIHINWIELLAYTACKGGGKFPPQCLTKMDTTAKRIAQGEVTMQELVFNEKYYDYYFEVYTAILGGYLDEYEKNGEKRYGLVVFSPIAKGFYYSDYDDFGTSRSFGYKRPHLGHDMTGLIGTPIIAVESGRVEALGWNRYGGWRIGIRSNDEKRYYYYAHLRQNRPYAKDLKEGMTVNAGDVIGYMGHTGYSDQENVNNIEVVHLHFGIQLIFDESQKESDNEIWIDCYQLARFLYRNRSEVMRDDETKEWYRTHCVE